MMQFKVRKRSDHWIIKKVLSKHFEILQHYQLLSDAGVEIEILGDLDLFDIALDIIGFPKDNKREFDLDDPGGISSPGSTLRRDFENMFSRGAWEGMAYGFEDVSNIDLDALVEQLFDDCTSLLVKNPGLFFTEDL